MALPTNFDVDWRLVAVLTFVLGTLLVAMLVSPLPQDFGYHSFADRRSMLGIPNLFDVVSNIPFLVVGVLGTRTVLRTTRGPARPAWLVLFAGVVMVSAGSAYYHLAPDNASLVWDRLPMTVGFMGLFVALLAEYLEPRLAKILLGPCILVGTASVFYWHFFDDLRFYAWVQFMPLGVVGLLVILYRSRFTHSWLLAVALAWYVLAKVFEALDVAVFQLFQETFSGHTIKHLSAAAGCYSLILLLQKRKPRTQS